jgi:hypothetical protein
MPSEIISEQRATSNRNGGRDHPGIPGDFTRNQQIGAAIYQAYSLDNGRGFSFSAHVPALTGKVRDNRLRRMADRQGYRLLKSRARDPRDLTFGGYQLVDVETGGLSFGYGNANRGYAADLDGIEEWLTKS